MAPHLPPPGVLTGPLSASLSALHPLAPDETAQLHELRGRVRTYAANDPIPRGTAEEGEPVTQVVVSGWAAHQRELPDRRRQLLDVVLPGDLLESASERRVYGHAPVVALSEVRLMDVPALLGAEPGSGLSVAVANAERAEERRLLDHVVRLGRLTALERMAHWLVEIEGRLRTVELSTGGGFRLPVTQTVIGEILGLSVVHVSRTLRELHRGGFVTTSAGWIEMRDLAGLTLLAARAAAAPAPGTA